MKIYFSKLFTQFYMPISLVFYIALLSNPVLTTEYGIVTNNGRLMNRG